ncbi:MAG: sensor domain-containing diguanylate cyclase [Pararhodobacter sp.]|nr:sensor domain-containing diguanylate cyclase [Pararhodobacter sp.]
MNARAALHSFPVATGATNPPSIQTTQLPSNLAALPNQTHFTAVADLIKTVFNVPAVSVALHGAPADDLGEAYRSFLEIPLIDNGDVIGALRILDTEMREFTDRDCVLLEGFAKLVVEQVALWAEASRDMLTNAMTRRAFTDTLRKTFASRQRTGGKNALVMFDLDHFKSVNDTWGHTAGDAVLRTVSRLVMRELRTEDSFGRLGGEEFGILLANADGEAAAEVAERIRQAIERAVVPDFEKINFTASFGVAELTDMTVSAEFWMSIADDQLYRAKDEGRNAVCLAADAARAVVLN